MWVNIPCMVWYGYKRIIKDSSNWPNRPWLWSTSVGLPSSGLLKSSKWKDNTSPPIMSHYFELGKTCWNMYTVLQQYPIQKSPFSASQRDLEKNSLNTSTVPLHECFCSWNTPKKNNKHSNHPPSTPFVSLVHHEQSHHPSSKCLPRPPLWRGHRDIRQCDESNCRTWPRISEVKAAALFDSKGIPSEPNIKYILPNAGEFDGDLSYMYSIYVKYKV